MTSRERLLTVLQGGEADRKPTLGWPTDPSAVSDATIVAPNEAKASADFVVLAEVINPFGRALNRGIALNDRLREDPIVGGSILDELVEEAKAESQAALQGGADGILYRLHGACGTHCSPMQYGGYYLERDREILADCVAAKLNVLFVVGDEDVYLDFVSDLPAHVFAWDSRASGVSSAQVRDMRSGPQASSDLESEIALTTDLPSIAHHLERNRLAV